MTGEAGGPHPVTAVELKAQIEAERTGRPFLAYRDAEGERHLLSIESGVTELWVGRSGGPPDQRLPAQAGLVGIPQLHRRLVPSLCVSRQLWLHTLRDGRIVHLRSFATWDEAFEAAGLRG